MKTRDTVILAYFGYGLVMTVIATLRSWPRASSSLSEYGTWWLSALQMQAGLSPYGDDLAGQVMPYGYVAVNMNPPTWLPVFSLLASVEPRSGLIVWFLVTVIGFFLSYAAMARHVPIDERPAFLALSMAAVGTLFTAGRGQVYLPMMLLAWASLRAPTATSRGLAMGMLVALKPSFALFAVATLIVDGRRTPAFVTSLASFVGLSIAWSGTSAWRDWIELAGAGLMTDQYDNCSFVSQPHLVALFAAALWSRPRLTLPAVLIVSMLASPIAWSAYSVVFWPFLAERWRDPRSQLAMLAMTVPYMYGSWNWAVFGVGFALAFWALLDERVDSSSVSCYKV